MEVVSTDSNGIVGIYPQQPELGAAWQIHFKMACVAFMSRWLVFTDPILILAMVLELEVFGLGLVEGGAEMRVWSRSVWKIGPVSEERVNSVYVMGSPLHQACWKAAGCCRGKWLPETLPSITRQVRPPNPAMRMEERRGGWGCRIRLEGTKTGKKTVEEQTINNLFLSLLDCFISFSSSAYLSLHVFLCFYFPVLHKTATRAFRNGPCWSESSPQLNCIINYSTGSGLEANLKRGREIESEQELDGEMGDSCLTPPVGLGLTLCLCLSLSLSANEGWERGGAWVTSVSGCVTFLRREVGLGGGFNELLKRTQSLVNTLRAEEPWCLASGLQVSDLLLCPDRER